MPYRRETREKERDTRSLNRLVSLSNQSKRLVFAFLVSLFLAFPTSAFAKMDRSDSSYVSTLNMTEEQKEKVYGVDSSTLAKGPTLQELNEENPTYVKREYDHKQQVVVGSVVMFCVALAMVLMNNYNPKR
ncbi:hypothetical protein FSU_0125 [Fibrobacter succinogenes subsp. succinogenes S85]|uniref:Uncharacterized protein n=3 Tax=Fibrobacteraceae TaxID=204431 RepID=C9RNY1_FIBSS|nr:hypothetical protein Fisuc_2867 [Fibrobacter succinogenes subsp. succinogenes S85]ADL26691.1 hypothetical protein FSU_0125 [Fibrobacter succinogenes subsp. succinogenes S85]